MTWLGTRLHASDRDNGTVDVSAGQVTDEEARRRRRADRSGGRSKSNHHLTVRGCCELPSLARSFPPATTIRGRRFPPRLHNAGSPPCETLPTRLAYLRNHRTFCA